MTSSTVSQEKWIPPKLQRQKPGNILLGPLNHYTPLNHSDTLQEKSCHAFHHILNRSTLKEASSWINHICPNLYYWHSIKRKLHLFNNTEWQYFLMWWHFSCWTGMQNWVWPGRAPKSCQRRADTGVGAVWGKKIDGGDSRKEENKTN